MINDDDDPIVIRRHVHVATRAQKHNFIRWCQYVHALDASYCQSDDCSDLIDAVRQGKTLDCYGLGAAFDLGGIKGSLDHLAHISKDDLHPLSVAAQQQRDWERQERERMLARQQQTDAEWERRGEEIEAERQRREAEIAAQQRQQHEEEMARRNEVLTMVINELKAVNIEPWIEDGRSHLKVRWTNPIVGETRTVIVSGTPSDRRARYNARSFVRRILRADGLIAGRSKRHRRKNHGKITGPTQSNNASKKGEVA
jgi:hypothetical protein